MSQVTRSPWLPELPRYNTLLRIFELMPTAGIQINPPPSLQSDLNFLDFLGCDAAGVSASATSLVGLFRGVADLED